MDFLICITFLLIDLFLPLLAEIRTNTNEKCYKLIKIQHCSFLFNGVKYKSVKNHGIILPMLLLQILRYIVVIGLVIFSLIHYYFSPNVQISVVFVIISCFYWMIFVAVGISMDLYEEKICSMSSKDIALARMKKTTRNVKKTLKLLAKNGIDNDISFETQIKHFGKMQLVREIYKMHVSISDSKIGKTIIFSITLNEPEKIQRFITKFPQLSDSIFDPKTESSMTFNF